MDEKHYKFVDFIEKVKDMDYHDIMEYGDREVARMGNMSYSDTGSESDRNMEVMELSEQGNRN